MRKIEMKRLTKFRCCFITFLVASIVLIVTCGLTPYLADKVID